MTSTLTPHPLTEKQYSDALYQLLLEESGTVKTEAYTDGKGIPTIGVGINIKVLKHIQTILETAYNITDTGNVLANKLLAVANKTWAANLHDSTAQTLHDELNKVMADYHTNHASAPSTFTLTPTQVKNVFDKLVPEFNKKVTDFLTKYNAPDPGFSLEKLALLSLAWNGPVLLGGGLGRALVDGNRADAWYEIRYGSNGGGDKPGVAKRRYLEAHLFGLYDGATATENEARNTYIMLDKHRTTIIDYEVAYGTSPASTDSTAQKNLKAAQDEYDILQKKAADAFPTATVATLIKSLTPAYNAFITYANTLHGTGAPDIDKSIISNAAAIFYNGVMASGVDDPILDARLLDGKENGLENNLLVGELGSDLMYGGKGQDELIGREGQDWLDAGDDNDILIGGVGNDILKGGSGNDKYVFSSGDGKDTIKDSDGIGSILVDGNTLTGGNDSDFVLVGNQRQWSVNNGQYIYTLDDQHKKLVISGTGLGAESTITIDDVDVEKILTGGYLGIALKNTLKTALVKGSGSNVFATAGFDPVSLVGLSSNVAEGTGTGFTIYLNQAAKAGDTLTLSINGAFQAVLGDSKVPANGAVITLVEGQTLATFGLVQEGEVTADASLQLSASFSGADGSAVSNVFGIELKDNGENTNLFNGDQRAKLIGVEVDLQTSPIDPGYNTYKWSGTSYDADGNLTNGIAEANFTDVIYGKTGNNKIIGLGGNDALCGLAGNDTIEGGDGDDLISGWGGSDRLLGGAGNDYLLGSSVQAISRAQKPTETFSDSGIFTAPADSTLLTQGKTWAVFRITEADGTPVNAITGAGAPQDADADYLDGGAGDDFLLAGGGSDFLNGGDDNDTLIGMGGNDVLDGGGGKDSLDGDGTVKSGYLNTLGGAQHGDDFLDGGAGDDRLIGGGGDDAVYGGADHDHLWGDGSVKAGDARYLDPVYHGNDYMDGEDGNDQLIGGGKDDTLYGGIGNEAV